MGDMWKQITGIGTGIFFRKSQSAIVVMSLCIDTFEAVWEDFEYQKEITSHWSNLKRVYDEALETLLEKLEEESDVFEHIKVIFAGSLRALEKCDERPELGKLLPYIAKAKKKKNES